MQTIATRAVECPQCAEQTRVSIPDENAELRVSHSVAAYGDQTAVSCSNGHRYWVVVC